MRLLAGLVALGLIGGDSLPKPAPRTFVSSDKALTFRSPAAASHCPLAKDWVGSDHGTVIFLSPPKACGPAGYSSSARNFRGDPPRIEIYYGYWFEDNAPPKCARAGTATVFGKARPICKGDQKGKVIRSIHTRYTRDGGIELSVTLITTLARTQRDLATLHQLLGTIRTCSTTDRDAKGKRYIYGEGLPCPRGGIF